MDKRQTEKNVQRTAKSLANKTKREKKVCSVHLLPPLEIIDTTHLVTTHSSAFDMTWIYIYCLHHSAMFKIKMPHMLRYCCT